ncbi:helix-turn-helix domain-containing protein [Bradyrhizobium erythrophlei]|uniref:helix-turn-helix domain-containing protein n=1 Tax=Bradyrhizobium erythrophlei TaxID=1437360 RepID=UPI00093498B9|nr:helix-turn-helix transcriptional regulator [Bradyrhizobium erythrophlei]
MQGTGRSALRAPRLATSANGVSQSIPFRQSTGYPPHRWLLQRRIERAQDLLLNSDKTLAEIARCCGFFDPSHLTRAFSQTVGSSPGLWRRSRRT